MKKRRGDEPGRRKRRTVEPIRISSQDPEHLSNVLRRIDRRQRSLGLTDRATSMLTGMSPELLRSIRKQFRQGVQHNISPTTLVLLSNALQTTPHWLRREEGPEQVATPTPHPDLTREQEPPTVIVPKTMPPMRRGRHGRPLHLKLNGSSTLKVTERIAAGVWFESGSQPPLPEETAGIAVPAHPQLPVDQQAAVSVGDSSVNTVANSGDILVVDIKGQPQGGELVLVSRTKSDLREVTVRRYIPVDDSVELRCESSDSRYQGGLKVAKKNMRADDGSTIKVEGVVMFVFRPVL